MVKKTVKGKPVLSGCVANLGGKGISVKLIGHNQWELLSEDNGPKITLVCLDNVWEIICGGRILFQGEYHPAVDFLAKLGKE